MATGFATADQAIVPEPGESEADFSWRVHQALAPEMGTDAAQSLAFQIWDQSKGDSPLLGIAAQRFGREQFERTPLSPIFSEHTSTSERRSLNPQTGQPEFKKVTTIYDRNALESVASRCNHRIEDTGDFPPLTDGHTPTHDQLARGAKQPDVLGYSGPFRVGVIGNKEPRWSIFAYEWHDKSAKDRLARLRRRSPEVWLEEKMEDRFLDPIAALGAETPRLDMGLTRFGRLGNGRMVEKYSSFVAHYDAAFPGPANTFVPGEVGGKRRKYAGEGDALLGLGRDVARSAPIQKGMQGIKQGLTGQFAEPGKNAAGESVPEGTKVHNVYDALKRKGYDKGKAARIAQSQTGQALATGKAPKHDYAAGESITDPLFKKGKESPDNEFSKTQKERAIHDAPGFSSTKPYAAESCDLPPGLDMNQTSLYAAGDDTPAGAEHDGEEGGGSVITPEDIQQIVAALEETEEFQWIHSQMGGGPEHAPGAPGEGGELPGEEMPPGGEMGGGMPGEEMGGLPPGGPPPGAAPPSIAQPPAEEPPGEPPGLDEKEKHAYAAMSHKMKCEYAAYRKKFYAADGSVMDDAAMRKDKEGTVIDPSIMKNSRGGSTHHELVARCSRLESEVAQLRQQNAREAFKATQAERYSRLQARSREFVFDLAEEWERVQGYSKEDFDAHCDGTIVANYSRIPIGVDLPPQDVGEPRHLAIGRDRQGRERKERAVAIYSRGGAKSWREAHELAGKELGIDDNAA